MSNLKKKKIEEFRLRWGLSGPGTLKWNKGKDLESFLLQTIQDTLDEVEKRLDKLYQDERPLDVITGEPVPTYGYEETHNQALQEAKQVIKTIRDEQTN